MIRWGIAGALLGCSLFAISCFKNAAGRRQLRLVPQSKMLSLGASAYQEMHKKHKRSRNIHLRKEIEAIGRRIAKASRKSFAWEFTLYDAPKTVNAFCLPGGKVGVFTGIIPIAKTNAGLAAIMGHEVAHAVLNHGTERMSQQMVAKAGLTLANLAVRGSKYSGAVMGALGLGAKFGVLLPYSRKHESEADTLGLRYMAIAGYDPRASVTLWQRMAKAAGKTPPEMLSTHPDPLKRSKALAAQIPGDIIQMYNRSRKVKTEDLPNP